MDVLNSECSLGILNSVSSLGLSYAFLTLISIYVLRRARLIRFASGEQERMWKLNIFRLNCTMFFFAVVQFVTSLPVILELSKPYWPIIEINDAIRAGLLLHAYICFFLAIAYKFYSSLEEKDRRGKAAKAATTSTAAAVEETAEAVSSCRWQRKYFWVAVSLLLFLSVMYVALSGNTIGTPGLQDIATYVVISMFLPPVAIYWQFSSAIARNELTQATLKGFIEKWVHSLFERDRSDIESLKYKMKQQWERWEFARHQSTNTNGFLRECWNFYDAERGFRVSYPTYGDIGDLKETFLPFDTSIFSIHPELIFVSGQPHTQKKAMTRAVFRAMLRRNYDRLKETGKAISQGAIIHMDIITRSEVAEGLSALDLYGLVKRRILEMEREPVPGFQILLIECLQRKVQKEYECGDSRELTRWDTPSIRRFCTLLVNDEVINKLQPTILILLDEEVSTELRGYLKREVEQFRDRFGRLANLVSAAISRIAKIGKNSLVDGVKKDLAELEKLSYPDDPHWKVRFLIAEKDTPEYTALMAAGEQLAYLDLDTDERGKVYEKAEEKMGTKQGVASECQNEILTYTPNSAGTHENGVTLRIIAWSGYASMLRQIAFDEISEDEITLDNRKLGFNCGFWFGNETNKFRVLLSEEVNGDKVKEKIKEGVPHYDLAIVDREYLGTLQPRLRPFDLAPAEMLKSALPLFSSLDYYCSDPITRIYDDEGERESQVKLFPIRFGMNGVVLDEKALNILRKEAVVSWSLDAHTEHLKLVDLLNLVASNHPVVSQFSVHVHDFPSAIELMTRRALRHLNEETQAELLKVFGKFDKERTWESMRNFLSRKSELGKVLIGPGDNMSAQTLVTDEHGRNQPKWKWLPIVGAGLLWMEGLVNISDKNEDLDPAKKFLVDKIRIKLEHDGFNWCVNEGDMKSYGGMPILGWRDSGTDKSDIRNYLEKLGYSDKVERLSRVDPSVAMNRFFYGAGLNSIGASLRGYFVPYDISEFYDLIYAGIIPDEKSAKVAKKYLKFRLEQDGRYKEDADFRKRVVDLVKSCEILCKKAATGKWSAIQYYDTYYRSFIQLLEATGCKGLHVKVKAELEL